ncbi:MAG: PH domain-containing protein [Bacillota bacterium]|nr:PH domain-containing protein [Bacillota bacterium]
MKFKKQADIGSLKTIVGIILIIVIFGGVFLAVKISKVNLGTDSLKISGLYGISVKYDDIQQVSLKDSLPQKLDRTNGIDFFGELLGKFQAEGMDKLKLFVKSKEGPFIYITTKEGEYVILNLKDKNETGNLYNELSSKAKVN